MWHWAQVLGSRAMRDRTGVPGVAGGAVADGAVAVGPSDAVALFASAGHGRSAFQLHEWMRRTASASGLIGFREVHLLGRQPLLAIDGSPRWSGMAAAQELLVDTFVATPAIARGQLGRDHEPVMVLLLLSGRGLVAFQAVHALAGVQAHFIFVDDRVLGASVTLGAFAGSSDQVGAGLLGFYFGSRTIDQECGHDECEGNDYCDEDRAKRHCGLWRNPDGVRSPVKKVIVSE